MQNGRFSHRDQTIKVAVSYDWDEGGHPNSVPFYVSTAGYGVLRNTFAPGSYSFTTPVLTSHEEQRFDAYYFVGDLKHVIDRYTELTGRPFMPPIYGLEMGDADCYLHSPRHGEIHTADALKVADEYLRHQIPLGWMLVNDGYGCGYEFLDQVAAGLDARNMQLGLWTSTGLGSHAAEVAAGVRVRKLDIGWVGPGYRAALSACQDAYQGMEQHSDSRGMVWLPEGLGRLPALRRALERRPEGQLGIDPLADPDLRRFDDVGPGLHHQRRGRDLRGQRPDLPAGPGVEVVPAHRAWP